MPCKCSGFKAEKCKCKVPGTVYRSTGGFSSLAHSKSICSIMENKSYSKNNFMFILIEAFYEKCASYNLRYCPIRGYTKHGSYFWSTLKDLVILTCFMIANFVVFLAIFTKTMVHLYHLLVLFAQWLTKILKMKMDENEPSVLIRAPPLHNDHPPSTSHKPI